MFTILRLDKPFVLALFPLITIAFWVQSLFHPAFVPQYYDTSAMPLYQLILYITPDHSTWAILLTLCALFFQAYLILDINNQHKLIDRATFIPGLMFLLIASSFVGLHQLNAVAFSGIFVTIGISRVFLSYKLQNSLKTLFEAAFFVSIASLFYFPALFFEFIVIMGLITLRTFNWREWISTLTGIIIPYILVISYFLFFDRLPIFWQTIEHNITPESGYAYMDVFYIIFYSFVLFIFTISIFFTFTQTIRKVSSRKFYSLLVWMFLFTAALLLLVPSTSVELLYFLAIPMAYFLSNYLINLTSLALAEVIFVTFAGSIIALHILH